MRTPSAVSNRLIPAAKRTGRTRVAYQGRSKAADPAASTSSATWVGVSSAGPTRGPPGEPALGAGADPEAHEQPTGEEVPGLAHPPDHPAEDAGQEAATVQVPLELRLVELPGAPPAEDLGDADGGTEVHHADEQQERAGDEGADQAEGLGDRGVPVLDDPRDRADPCDQQQAGGEDDRRVAEGEPESRADR